MNKAYQKGSQDRMSKLIPLNKLLQQELFQLISNEDTIPGIKPNKNIIIKQKDDVNEALSLGEKGNEEGKFDDQFSQSSISGKPSPFMNNETEIPLFRQES